MFVSVACDYLWLCPMYCSFGHRLLCDKVQSHVLLPHSLLVKDAV